MRIFCTEIKAIDPKDGELKTWGGDNVKSITWTHAQEILNRTGRGYMKVTGELVSEIDSETGEKTDYNYLNN